jgi:Domain of unknown function (DUF1772)
MLADWGYTVVGILPLNQRLNAITPAETGPDTRAMLDRWNRLHAIRTGLSGIATLALIWAAAA